MLRNMLKLPPWFPGQMGVPGSDTPEGIRYIPQGLTLYVDVNHPDANDNHDGTDPKYPLATIQGAVGKLANNGDQIVIDISKRKLELKISPREIKERLAKWRAPAPKIKDGYLARYAKLVSSASEGAIFK